MERLKRTVAAGLIMVIGLFSMAACRKMDQSKSSRGPLKIKKISYLVYYGGAPDVDLYVITSDQTVMQYSYKPEGDKTYDYLGGELPPDGWHRRFQFAITESEWTSIVNVLTRVNFMELKKDTGTKEHADDGSSYYIKVETGDSANVSGGYLAGYDSDSDSRRFAQARDMIERALKIKGITKPTEDDGPAPPFDGSRISHIDLERVNSEGIEFTVSPDYIAGEDLVILCKSEAELSLSRVFKYSPYNIEDIAAAVKKADEGNGDVHGYIADVTEHCTLTKTDDGYALSIDSECVNTETNYYVELNNGARLHIRCK
jgi:hypothetical protein